MRLVHILLLGLFLTLGKGTGQVGEEPTTKRRGVTDNNGLGKGGKRPNVILILTDDQDLHMNSLDYMPLLKKHLIDEGTLYRRHFCTNALCCPSRATLLVCIRRVAFIACSFEYGTDIDIIIVCVKKHSTLPWAVKILGFLDQESRTPGTHVDTC